MSGLEKSVCATSAVAMHQAARIPPTTRNLKTEQQRKPAANLDDDRDAPRRHRKRKPEMGEIGLIRGCRHELQVAGPDERHAQEHTGDRRYETCAECAVVIVSSDIDSSICNSPLTRRRFRFKICNLGLLRWSFLMAMRMLGLGARTGEPHPSVRGDLDSTDRSHPTFAPGGSHGTTRCSARWLA